MNSGELEQVLNDPVMEVFVISNGFLLKVYSYDRQNWTMTYAKDEVAIAEEIIAAQARHKLDIEPKQGEMFSPEEMDRRKKK